MLEAGELGPISSVILPYYDTCSVCGEVLDADWENHPCIAENKAFSEVQSFQEPKVIIQDANTKICT